MAFYCPWTKSVHAQKACTSFPKPLEWTSKCFLRLHFNFNLPVLSFSALTAPPSVSCTLPSPTCLIPGVDRAPILSGLFLCFLSGVSPLLASSPSYLKGFFPLGSPRVGASTVLFSQNTYCVLPVFWLPCNPHQVWNTTDCCIPSLWHIVGTQQTSAHVWKKWIVLTPVGLDPWLHPPFLCFLSTFFSPILFSASATLCPGCPFQRLWGRPDLIPC